MRLEKMSLPPWDREENEKQVHAHTCSMASGVEIMPPHRVTRARERQEAHRTTSSCSIWSAMALIWGLLMRIALMKSWQ